MCSYIVEKTAIEGSAKGPNGWMRIDTANVYFDHPYHAPFSHALAIDFVCEANGAPERVAVELSADAARALVKSILAALASGDAAHRSVRPPSRHWTANVTRRALVSGTFALASEPVAALAPAAPKGPTVWLAGDAPLRRMSKIS